MESGRDPWLIRFAFGSHLTEYHAGTRKSQGQG